MKEKEKYDEKYDDRCEINSKYHANELMNHFGPKKNAPQRERNWKWWNDEMIINLKWFHLDAIKMKSKNNDTSENVAQEKIVDIRAVNDKTLKALLIVRDRQIQRSETNVERVNEW